MPLPPLVAAGSRRSQEAYALWLANPKLRNGDIAEAVGVATSTISKWKREQAWKDSSAKQVTESIDSTQSLAQSMVAEAHRARRSHLTDLPKAYQLAMLKLQEVAELDDEGNIVGLKEVVVGHDSRGNPIHDTVPMRDVQALVNTIAKHWEHAGKVTGLELAEKKELAAARNDGSQPGIVLNVHAMPPPQPHLIGGSDGQGPVLPAESEALPDL